MEIPQVRKTNHWKESYIAFKYAIKDMLPFFVVLTLTTIVLGYFFFIYENEAQPTEYPDLLKAFAWISFNYIGDPGKFGGNGPITIEGRSISNVISIIKILIIAVPAGLLSNAFKKAREEEKERVKLEECERALVLAFRRKQVKEYGYDVVPRRMPVSTLIAKKGLQETNIIKVVMQSENFRMRNLASSQPTRDYPVDRWVLEILPLDKFTIDGFPIHRLYIEGKKHCLGIYVDRKSTVTIIAPTAASENSIGHFAYHLAQFGGFNYISKEFEEDVNKPISFFNISNEDKVKPFIDQVKALNEGKVKWNVVLISTESIHDAQFHFIHQSCFKGTLLSTTKDENTFKSLFDSFLNEMKSSFNYESDLDKEYYKQNGDINITVKIGGGVDNNAFTLRVAYSVTTWSDRPTPILVKMAEVFRESLIGSIGDIDNNRWKGKGYGYGKEQCGIT